MRTVPTNSLKSKTPSDPAVPSRDLFGIMGDGGKAPINEDYERLDFMSRNPGKVKSLKGGFVATDVPHCWQPGLRPAIDAAMETLRRSLRASGGNPVW